jgi:predicted porin
VARTSQMRFTINNLRIAFLQTDTSKDGFADPTGGGNDFNADQDVLFPKLEMRYDLKGDWGVMNFIGGYQTYKAVHADGNQDQTITSWVAGIRGKFNFGPAYLGASLTYRQNGDNYGAWTTVDELAKFDGFDVQDATAYGGVFALGYKINDSNTIEASYGILTSDQDLPGNWEDKRQAFGLMYKYTVAPGFYIVPEFIYQDNKSTETGTGSKDNGDTTIFGVFWRIDFK